MADHQIQEKHSIGMILLMATVVVVGTAMLIFGISLIYTLKWG